MEESEILSEKWYPYNKGGSFRKWFGNHDLVVNWQTNGYELRNFKKSVLRNQQFYFKESLSWSKVSTSNIAFRYYPKGFIFDVAGCSLFLEDNLEYIFGFLNSKVSACILDLISPTINYEVGHISSLPVRIDLNKKDEIDSIVKSNIEICKKDWDDYETSWNFNLHPLLYFNERKIEDIFDLWDEYKQYQFKNLKSNEIKLNEIFGGNLSFKL